MAARSCGRPAAARGDWNWPTPPTALRPLGRDGYPTMPAFFFGWPTTEMAPLYMAGFDARRGLARGCAATSRRAVAESALLLKAITWGLL